MDIEQDCYYCNAYKPSNYIAKTPYKCVGSGATYPSNTGKLVNANVA
ncbi:MULTISPECIES: hypothetical protein [Ferroplasma]|nr:MULTISPECIES: hypothetical protein [Ferroplasma]WMT52503.1 MAG: hypothetical protein RE473_05700 [Ferroplasma acidiphilum]